MIRVDLLTGYYQIPLTTEARQISAFLTSFGLYEYIVMSFGFRNAPSTFQRVVNDTIRGMAGVTTYYLDIFLLTGNIFPEHYERLEILFTRLDKRNMPVNLSKSNFFTAQLEYLGHVLGIVMFVQSLPMWKLSYLFQFLRTRSNYNDSLNGRILPQAL